MSTINKLYIISILTGWQLHTVQKLLGMHALKQGVKYYGEVHKSFWNSCIHTLFMPVTMFGMYLWIPGLFKLSNSTAWHLRHAVSLAYVLHYSRINIFKTFLVAMLYYKPLLLASKIYRRTRPSQALWIGLVSSTCALAIQEVVGHYIGGDDPSRAEAIPNAIIYAPYYSVSHFFRK